MIASVTRARRARMKRIKYAIAIAAIAWVGFSAGIMTAEYRQRQRVADIERGRYVLRMHSSSLYQSLQRVLEQTENVTYHMGQEQLYDMYYVMRDFRDEVSGIAIDVGWWIK
jgi:hypothetical protein